MTITDISEWVKKNVTLEMALEAAGSLPARKTPGNYMWKCFKPEKHANGDKMPSLSIKTGGYKCFTCGISGGSAIDLWIEYTGKPFADAVRDLAERFGMPGLNHIPKVPEWLRPESPSKEAHNGHISNDIIYYESDLSECLKTVKQNNRLNLFDFICKFYNKEDVKTVFDTYFVGKSKEGLAIFWYVDFDEGRNIVRTGKIIKYLDNGKRDRGVNPNWAHVKMNKPYDVEIKIPFFGQHLLRDLEPGARVGIVESEKTALICKLQFPNICWVATGGVDFLPTMKDFLAKNTKYEKLLTLKGLNVGLFADNDKAGQTWLEHIETGLAIGNIESLKFVDWQRTYLDNGIKIEVGDDLADIIIRESKPAVVIEKPETIAPTIDFEHPPESPVTPTESPLILATDEELIYDFYVNTDNNIFQILYDYAKAAHWKPDLPFYTEYKSTYDVGKGDRICEPKTTFSMRLHTCCELWRKGNESESLQALDMCLRIASACATPVPGDDVLARYESLLVSPPPEPQKYTLTVLKDDTLPF